MYAVNKTTLICWNGLIVVGYPTHYLQVTWELINKINSWSCQQHTDLFFFSLFQFSNFIFILFPPILIHLFKDYGYFINQGIHIIWVLLIIVGLSSAYFHATLSLIGQLLDEVAILWVCSAAFSMFSPKAIFPKFIKGDR